MDKQIAAITAATGLALMCASPICLAEEHEEESINASDVPAAVQKAADKRTGGAQVRWEKERGHYEAVIEKDGKQWGYVFDKNGKMLSKHDESKEKSESVNTKR